MKNQFESTASEQRRSARGRAWVLFSFVLAGLVLAGLGLAMPFLRRRDAVDMTQQFPEEQAFRPEVPPIDTAVWADVQTATFALG